MGDYFERLSFDVICEILMFLDNPQDMISFIVSNPFFSSLRTDKTRYNFFFFTLYSSFLPRHNYADVIYDDTLIEVEILSEGEVHNLDKESTPRYLLNSKSEYLRQEAIRHLIQSPTVLLKQIKKLLPESEAQDIEEKLQNAPVSIGEHVKSESVLDAWKVYLMELYCVGFESLEDPWAQPFFQEIYDPDESYYYKFRDLAMEKDFLNFANHFLHSQPVPEFSCTCNPLILKEIIGKYDPTTFESAENVTGWGYDDREESESDSISFGSDSDENSEAETKKLCENDETEKLCENDETESHGEREVSVKKMKIEMELLDQENTSSFMSEERSEMPNRYDWIFKLNKESRNALILLLKAALKGHFAPLACQDHESLRMMKNNTLHFGEYALEEEDYQSLFCSAAQQICDNQLDETKIESFNLSPFSCALYKFRRADLKGLASFMEIRFPFSWRQYSFENFEQLDQVLLSNDSVDMFNFLDENDHQDESFDPQFSLELSLHRIARRGGVMYADPRLWEACWDTAKNFLHSKIKYIVENKPDIETVSLKDVFMSLPSCQPQAKVIYSSIREKPLFDTSMLDREEDAENSEGEPEYVENSQGESEEEEEDVYEDWYEDITAQKESSKLLQALDPETDIQEPNPEKEEKEEIEQLEFISPSDDEPDFRLELFNCSKKAHPSSPERHCLDFPNGLTRWSATSSKKGWKHGIVSNWTDDDSDFSESSSGKLDSDMASSSEVDPDTVRLRGDVDRVITQFTQQEKHQSLLNQLHVFKQVSSSSDSSSESDSSDNNDDSDPNNNNDDSKNPNNNKNNSLTDPSLSFDEEKLDKQKVILLSHLLLSEENTSFPESAFFWGHSAEEDIRKLPKFLRSLKHNSFYWVCFSYLTSFPGEMQKQFFDLIRNGDIKILKLEFHSCKFDEESYQELEKNLSSCSEVMALSTECKKFPAVSREPSPFVEIYLQRGIDAYRLRVHKEAKIGVIFEWMRETISPDPIPFIICQNTGVIYWNEIEADYTFGDFRVQDGWYTRGYE